MDRKLIEQINEEAPMGRIRGDWWYDELTDVQANLMEAPESVRHAAQAGFNSVGDFVTETTDNLIDIEDTICQLLGECVAKKRQIEKARKAK